MQRRDEPITEAVNAASADLDRMTAREIVDLMNREDERVVEAVASQREAIAAALDAVAARLAQGGRLFYVGAGTSGRLGVVDASECPPTFQSDPEQVQAVIAGGDDALRTAVEGAEDDPEGGADALRARELSAGDAVIGIAASGSTPFVLGALRHARSIGAYTAAIVCNRNTSIAAAAEQPIEVVVGPEVLAGSTRLKAGTATKMVLNMISTGAMVKLGKTFGNLMVHLAATNQKLERRALNLLVILTGLEETPAQDLLRDCGGELKTAVLVHRLAIPPSQARIRLEAAGGRLRDALEGASNR